tara:strand:- start:10453 stop:10899 length:447 start_codon:yes stop_codon:yes gene_type:complete
MRKIIFFITLVIGFSATGQILNPVKWSTSVKKISINEYELIATAKIENEWHLYAQNVPKGGPIPTSFTYLSSRDYLKKGNTKEDKGQVVDDPIFDMRIKYFDEKAKFIQRVKLKSKAPFVINAIVEYMACNDTQCLAPKEVDLVFNIK